jgi:hypothetical protein
MSEWNRKFGFTMIHGDFHGQNMLQRGDSADTIAFLDWQVGGGGTSIAFCFSTQSKRTRIVFGNV